MSDSDSMSPCSIAEVISRSEREDMFDTAEGIYYIFLRSMSVVISILLKFYSSLDNMRFSSSMSGKALRSSSGISAEVVYVATPIGLL